MSLLDLPNELLLSIGEYLDSEADISSFLRTKRRLHDLLVSYLYRHNIKHHSSFCLHWVAQYGQAGTAKEAIAQGADLNSAIRFDYHADPAGLDLCFEKRPISRAAAAGHKELVVVLLDAGADLVSAGPEYTAGSCYTMETYSAMIEAIMTPHASVEMVQILIDRGADVNGQHRMEWTPLVQAVVNNKLEIAQLLLENGADPNLPSARPMPLDMAIRRGTAAMAQLFRGYGTLTPYEACTVGSSSQREPPSGTSNLSETAYAACWSPVWNVV